MKPYISKNKQKILINFSATIFILILWELLSRFFPVPFLLSGPWKAAIRFGELLKTVEFWKIVFFSSRRILIGLIFGIILGIISAVLANLNTWLAAFLKQIASILKTVPIAVITILLLILFSNRWITSLIVFIMTFPIVFNHYLHGLESCDPKMLEVAIVFQFDRKKKWQYIYMKSAEPFLKSALEISGGMAWKAGIAAEILGIPQYSFGEKIYSAKIFLESADIFAYAIAIVLLSIFFEKIIVAIFLKTHRLLRGLAA